MADNSRQFALDQRLTKLEETMLTLMTDINHKFDLIMSNWQSSYRDLKGELTKLQQHTTVQEYYDQFEKLANQVKGVQPSMLQSFFESGLQSNIRREVQALQPQSFQHAFQLAKLMEDRFYPFHQFSYTQPSPPILSNPPNSPVQHSPYYPPIQPTLPPKTYQTPLPPPTSTPLLPRPPPDRKPHNQTISPILQPKPIPYTYQIPLLPPTPTSPLLPRPPPDPKPSLLPLPRLINEQAQNCEEEHITFCGPEERVSWVARPVKKHNILGSVFGVVSRYISNLEKQGSITLMDPSVTVTRSILFPNLDNMFSTEGSKTEQWDEQNVLEPELWVLRDAPDIPEGFSKALFIV